METLLMEPDTEMIRAVAAPGPPRTPPVKFIAPRLPSPAIYGHGTHITHAEDPSIALIGLSAVHRPSNQGSANCDTRQRPRDSFYKTRRSARAALQIGGYRDRVDAAIRCESTAAYARPT